MDEKHNDEYRTAVPDRQNTQEPQGIVYDL